MRTVSRHNAIPEVNCSKCGGSGKQTLSPPQFQALVALQHAKGKVTAPELWLRSDRKVSITAWNGRLQELVVFGLAKRSGRKPVLYESISPC